MGRECTVQDAQQVLVVPDFLHVDSAVEYVPPRYIPEADGSARRILPMRLAKLHWHIVVDAVDLSDPARNPQLDTGDSPSGSDSGCESGSGSGSGSGRVSGSGSGSGSGSASDASDADATSSAITVSSFDLEAAAPAPLPRKKFRRTTLRAGHSLSQRPAPIVVDVDAASSPTLVTHLLPT